MTLRATLGFAAFCLALATPSRSQRMLASATATVSAPPGFSAELAATLPPWQRHFERWIDLRQFTFIPHYRAFTTSNDVHHVATLSRSLIDGSFRFNAAGTQGIVFRALSLHDRHFAVRRLYLDLQPRRGVEMQFGGLDLNRGVSGEVSTFDNDFSMVGTRILLKKPRTVFFDEASITCGFFGDLTTPSFFDRGSRLAQSNYHQFLLRKKLPRRLDTSVDYTWLQKANTFHEAVAFDTIPGRVFDSIRLEGYQRINTVVRAGSGDTVSQGHGYAITIDRRLTRRLDTELGIANIDTNLIFLAASPHPGAARLIMNADQYALGKRFFIRQAVKLAPFVDAMCFYTHDLGPMPGPPLRNRQLIQGRLVFDIRKAIFRNAAVQ